MKREIARAIRFKSKAEKLLSKMEDLIETMPEKGETSSECQKIALRQACSKLYYAVNGVEASDFRPHPDYA